MHWPAPDEYNEAMQSPALTLGDPDLQRGIPELSALGLPKPITGNFACVYKVDTPAGVYAVRCFLRHYADQQKRYAAISEHLQRAGLPCLTKVSYVTRGIRVQDTWYPIVKMKWVEGQTLDKYVTTHLAEPNTLRNLVGRWSTAMQALMRQRIAHGDLQHGNIIVSQGHLKLVDYDGMFVPALAGSVSHELGHPNYQHPLRGEQHFGTFVDHFSAWVIYTSLLVLSIDPGLWQGGEDRLLFGQEDLHHLDSELWETLVQHSNAEVRTASQALRSLCQHVKLEDIPPLRGRRRGLAYSKSEVATSAPLTKASALRVEKKGSISGRAVVFGAFLGLMLSGMPALALLTVTGAGGIQVGVGYWRWPLFAQRRQAVLQRARLKAAVVSAQRNLDRAEHARESAMIPVQKWLDRLRVQGQEQEQRVIAQLTKIEDRAARRLHNLATERQRDLSAFGLLKNAAYAATVQKRYEWRRHFAEAYGRWQKQALQRKTQAVLDQLSLLEEESNSRVEEAVAELTGKKRELEKVEQGLARAVRPTFRLFLAERFGGILSRFGFRSNPPVHYQGSYKVTRHVNSSSAHVENSIDTNNECNASRRNPHTI